ncbi:molybdenum cofactor biosynthesis protein MoaE [Gammaproteobacteria bacterium 42_54_T18]|nr:molybdenum cofactor biosynthesis protein MoaE [Gammaproteobacteria bacterium 42_54_T18]
MSIKVQSEIFDAASEVSVLRSGVALTGALVEFTGFVRDISEGSQVSAMYLEHYPGMTEKSLHKIAEKAIGRWQLFGVSIVHRVGRLGPTEPIVYVAVISEHRKEAFEACEFIMDFLKTDAPFWKKEWNENDEAAWVGAKESDGDAATRW